MTLIPTDRLKSLQKQYASSELKLIRQNKYRKELTPSNDKVSEYPPKVFKKPTLNYVLTNYEGKDKERAELLLEHLEKNDNRINMDKRTNEMVFDGKLSTGSDINQLVDHLISTRKTNRKPSGWKSMKQFLEVTDAPTEIYGKSWPKIKSVRGRKNTIVKDWSKI